MRMWSIALKLLLLAASGLACGPADGDDAPELRSPTQPPSTSTAAPGQPPPAAVVDRARADLATRLAIAPADVAVVELCALTWPDGSIGVREPNIAYVPALVEGWLLVLESAGEEYRYHGAGERFVAADFVAGAEVDSVRCP